MNGFSAFRRKMETADLPEMVIETFGHYYDRLQADATGHIPEADIESLTPDDVIDFGELESYRRHGREMLNHLAVIKLNGGLGTSMGLQGPKSLIEVRDGLTFLDCSVRHVRWLNNRHDARVPLVLMNSFSTDEESLEFMRRYPDMMHGDLPLSFLQHRFPKVLREDLTPVSWPSSPELEWNPPGHGDIYSALSTSGMLDTLLSRDITHAFVSNCDNLGALVDTGVLGYIARTGLSFFMEVARRTEMDKKGGHLAKRPDGTLILRESAQCPDEDAAVFADIDRHRFFNTNNIWLNLKDLKQTLSSRNNVLELPLIVNRKTVDPRDPSSPPVYQLETAMGSALSVFDKAGVVAVPRSRFVPVKNCIDLVDLWSDRYMFKEEHQVLANPSRRHDTITLELDPRYYSRIDDLAARFPKGAPSLRECSSLSVEGDIVFGSGVKIVGAAEIRNRTDTQVHVPDETVVEKAIIYE